MRVEWTSYRLAHRRIDGRGMRGGSARHRVSQPGGHHQMGGAAAGRGARAPHCPGQLPRSPAPGSTTTSPVSPRPFAYPDYLKRWFDLSPAQIAVFETLRKIPLGETRSYDDVARATRLHPRQIGWLVAANHLAILVPCHRVVGKDGGLVGYGGGIAKKRWLLDHELRAAGVVFR